MRRLPLISVVITTYKQEKYIGQTIESVLSQGVDDLEVLVLDDCSPDATREVVARYLEDERVRYIRHAENLGDKGNNALALKKGRGKYMVWLHGDDYLLPGHLRSYLDVMEAHPECALIYSPCYWVDENDRVLRVARHPGHPDFDYAGGRNEVAELLAWDNYITPSSAMFRQSDLDKVETLDPNIKGSDWDLFIRLAIRNPDFAYLNVPSTAYRISTGQGSTSFYASTDPLKTHLHVLNLAFSSSAGKRLWEYKTEIGEHLERRVTAYKPQDIEYLADELKTACDNLGTIADTGITDGMQLQPLVSVIVPTKDRPELLQDTLRSINEQAYSNWEVVVVNDGGENVEAIVRALDKFNRFRYVRHETSKGLPSARNTGIRFSRGDILCYLDDDDTFRPQHLETVVNALLEKQAPFVYTEAEYIDEQVEDGVRKQVGCSQPYSGIEYSQRSLHVSNYIPVNTWAHRRELLDASGLFDPELPSLEDWDLLLRFSRLVDFVHIPELTVEVHVRQSGHMSQRERKEFPALFRLLYERYPLDGLDVEAGRERQLCALGQGQQQQVESGAGQEEFGLENHDIALFENRMRTRWSKCPSVHIVLIDVHTDKKPVVDSITSVVSQLYSGWGLSVISGRQAIMEEFGSEPNLEWITTDCVEKELQKLISESSTDWITFLFSGDQLERHYLVSMLDLADVTGNVEVVYSDTDSIDNNGERSDEKFKPDVDIDLLRSSDYIGNACLLKTETVQKNISLVSLAYYSFVYGILLKIIEDGGEGVFAHDTTILFHGYDRNADLESLPASICRRKEYLEQHLERSGLKSQVIEGYTPGVFYVEYQHATAPLVSIIIPTRDKLEILEPCISSLLGKTGYRNFEVIVVDNNSRKPETLEYFDKIQRDDSRVRVVKYQKAYNYSAINNMAAGLAKGNYLLLLNNDTAVIKGDWLDRMLSLGQREDVGVVGARLLFPDTTIQHAGVVVGMTGSADHSHIGSEAESPGYMGQNLTVRGVSAVTAACLMIKKDLYFSVGGLDEDEFAVLFNDVDLCLKARETGFRVVYTPYALMMHHGSFSLKKKVKKQDYMGQRKHECLAFIRKWLPVLANDPAYNRNLSLTSRDVIPEDKFIRSWDLHRHDCLRIVAFPTDKWSDDSFPVKSALSLLQNNNRLRCAFVPAHGDVGTWTPQPVELERGKPDVLLFCAPLPDLHLNTLEFYSEFNKTAFRILILDDVQCLPTRKHKKRASAGIDKAQRVRTALAYCDRLLVPTRQLADAWSGIVEDIQVVPALLNTAHREGDVSCKDDMDVWLAALIPTGATFTENTVQEEPVSAVKAQLANNADTDPKTAYRHWMEIHNIQERDIQRFTRRMMSGWTLQPSVHLVMTHVKGQEEALADTLDSLGKQLYGGWGLSIVSETSCPDPVFEELEMLEWHQVEGDLMDGVNTIIGTSGADWVGLLEAGTTLEPHALYQYVERLHRQPELRLVYMDEDRIDERGDRYDPMFKPEFNLELLRAMPYMGKFILMERKALVASGAYAPETGAESYDAVFRLVEQFGDHTIGHIPDVLVHHQDRFQLDLDLDVIAANRRASVMAHLQRCGINGEAKPGALFGSCFVDYACDDKPPVEIIVPVTGKPEMLELFLGSLLSQTQYPDFRVRLLVRETVDIPVDLCANDNVDVIRYSQSGNHWQEILELVRNSDAGSLMLMSPGAIVIQPNWLDRLVAHFQKPDVSVVAPRLVSSDKTVVGGGIITGAGSYSVGMGAFDGLALEDSGYMGRAQVAQELSAVSASCMLVRKSVFESVEGVSTSLRLAFYQAVDFCLRVRESGGKIVWTPHSTLMFAGDDQSGLEGLDVDELIVTESGSICKNSLAELANDPAYNPNLRLTGERFLVDGRFTPPWSPDDRTLSRIVGFGTGSIGCWKFRIEQPLSVMHRERVVNSLVLPHARGLTQWPSIVELERLQPDTLLMHNTMHDVYMDTMEAYRKVNNAFVVFGQDDLMFALPPKNPFSKTGYKDTKKRLRRCLGIADRVIVTTEPLAEELRSMADDIRVVPNYLDGAVWDKLTSKRATSEKPRVGWAGAQQHLGDLELLEEVVRKTAHEVDWIFFGMCPDFLQPYVKEIHDPVTFGKYPEKLATLNLDLAMAPLEYNRFNNSKSNLRILEYGALGWPVIASDIAPYHEGPVCRVPNQPRAWIKAIRERIHDMDATRAEGDVLHAWVRENWLLQQHMNEWLAALDPADDSALRQRRQDQAAGL